MLVALDDMEIKKFTFNPVGVNTYVCWDKTGECVIIDAGCSNNDEENVLASFIEEENLKPVRLLNTHGHFDHIMGNLFVAKKWNLTPELHEADIFLSERAQQQAIMFGIDMSSTPDIEMFLKEGGQVDFGDSFFRVIHVPGHSPGSVVFYCEDQGIVIVGDVLFNASIGRTDLPQGDHDTLIAGIRKKLLVLPDNTEVFPGHGPETTIGIEKKINPFLQ
jgi:glyoxylase-like metal-dependent hydrolase (beta-lactamase superfamily II)